MFSQVLHPLSCPPSSITPFASLLSISTPLKVSLRVQYSVEDVRSFAT